MNQPGGDPADADQEADQSGPIDSEQIIERDRSRPQPRHHKRSRPEHIYVFPPFALVEGEKAVEAVDGASRGHHRRHHYRRRDRGREPYHQSSSGRQLRQRSETSLQRSHLESHSLKPGGGAFLRPSVSDAVGKEGQTDYHSQKQHGTVEGCHLIDVIGPQAFSLGSLLTLAECRIADEADPLGDRRAFFDLPPDLIYLDGNSLGPPTQSVRGGVEQVLSDWRSRLIAGWWESGWVDLPRIVGARLEPIVGAEPGSVVCSDSTSVNLFKAVTAMCGRSSGDILTDVGNFPSCLYILESIARQHRRRLRVVDPDEVLPNIDSDVGVVSLTQVDFRSGRLHNMEEITRRAGALGAMTVWDLSHSAGVIPIELARWEVDAAVGCGYKYLNGGPGAPAYIYISPRHSDEVANPINGWFSHRSPFDFSTEFVPAEGIDRMRTGTPDIISMAGLNEALKAYEAIGVEQVWKKSVALTTLFIDLIDREVGCEVLTPREPQQRGSQVSLRIPQAEKLMSMLSNEGVIGDFRPPDVARFGFSPLYIRYQDVWRATAAIKSILARI